MNNAGVLTFLALASVLLWFIISGKGRWWPKLIAIISVLAFGAIIWFSALSFTGWPSHSGLPDKALFVSGYAVEPNDESDGAIYLWLVSPPENKTIYEYRAKDGEPRAYVLQYTREMHEQVQAATAAASEGRRVVFSSKAPEGGQSVQGEEGQQGGQGQSSGHGRENGPRSGNQGGQSGTRGGAPGFYILPPSEAEPKDG